MVKKSKLKLPGVSFFRTLEAQKLSVKSRTRSFLSSYLKLSDLKVCYTMKTPTGLSLASIYAKQVRFTENMERKVCRDFRLVVPVSFITRCPLNIISAASVSGNNSFTSESFLAILLRHMLSSLK